MKYIVYSAVLLSIILIVALLLRKPKQHKGKRYDSRGFDSNRTHKNGTKYDDFGFDYFGYDAAGYNVHGYSALGKNVKGQYNRFFDTTACKEEGFLNPNIYQIALTDHARMRLSERLGIDNYSQMNKLAMDAYRYGKSKRQIKRTSAALVHDIEQSHDSSIVLIYKNYIYIFSCENVLITVFKNDRIPI